MKSVPQVVDADDYVEWAKWAKPRIAKLVSEYPITNSEVTHWRDAAQAIAWLVQAHYVLLPTYFGNTNHVATHWFLSYAAARIQDLLKWLTEDPDNRTVFNAALIAYGHVKTVHDILNEDDEKATKRSRA